MGIYLDQIMPREFGKAEPWNFICKRKNCVNLNPIDDIESHEPRLIDQGNFEKDADYLKRGQALKIRNLRKCYANGFTAVKNESMTMYKG